MNGRFRRVIVLAGLATVVATALTACEKPAPGVSVVSGTTSRHAEATCWSFELGTDNSERTCAQNVIGQINQATGLPQVPLVQGSTIGISVDPVVAERGWYPIIGTQRLSSVALTGTHFNWTVPQLQLDQLPANGLTLQVISVGDGSRPSGLWLFSLVSPKL